MATEETLASPISNINIGTNVVTTNIVTDDQQLQAVLGHDRPAVKVMYSLSIFDTQSEAVKLAGDQPTSVIDPKGNSKSAAEYFFRVPPSVHEMGDPFATSIVPTQNGGRFVESHGSIIKDIKVSGTTGLRPNKLRRDAVGFLKDIPLFGDALSSAADDIAALGDNPLKPRGLPNPKERTGFVEIIHLRNLFRHYSDIKSGESSSKYIMLWANGKDADYWVVEPVDFRLTQDSKSPMTYKYVISLKALSRFDAKFAVPKDTYSISRGIQSFARRLGEVDRALRTSFNTVNNQINRVEGQGVFLQSAVLGPMITTIQGIASVNNTVNNFGAALELNARTLKNNLNEALDQLSGSPPGPDGQPVAQAAAPLTAQDPVVNALRRALIATTSLLSESSLRDSPTRGARDKIARASEAYLVEGGNRLSGRSPANGGSSLSISNERLANNFSIAKVNLGDNIKSLAQRLLGDPGRWKTLVLLNNLRAPFVADAGGEDVLQPGDDILYPSVGATGPGPEIVNISTVKEDQGQSIAEQAFGRDARLKSIRDGNVQVSDVVIGQAGDWDTISGIPNVEQALKLKFSTEKGELTVHPSFGARFPIGKKITAASFNTFSIQTRSTILSDPRVEGIELLSFNSSGDVMVVSAKLLLKNANTLLTRFVLERGSENF